MTYQIQDFIFTETSNICRDKRTRAQSASLHLRSNFSQSENALQVPGRGSDQHPGADGGQQGEDKKAPVRKSSLVTVKNPLRKTSFVSFDENRTTIGTQDTTKDNEDKDTENGSSPQSLKKTPNDGTSHIFLNIKI